MWFIFGFAAGYFMGRNPAQTQAALTAGGRAASSLLNATSDQLGTSGGTPVVAPVNSKPCPPGFIRQDDGSCRAYGP